MKNFRQKQTFQITIGDIFAVTGQRLKAMLGALVKILSALDLRALEILREIFISSDQFNKRIIQ